MINYKTFKGANLEQIVVMQDTIRKVASTYGNSFGEMASFEQCYIAINLLHWKSSYIQGFSGTTKKQAMKFLIECVKMRVFCKMMITR